MISVIFVSEVLSKEEAIEFFKETINSMIIPFEVLMFCSIVGDIIFSIVNYIDNKKLNEEYFGKKEKKE
jgi:hypothetical protein